MDKFANPFSRAYALQLHSYGIDPTEFIQFIDGLNEAHLGSTTLQHINKVANVVGTFPHRIAHIVGLTVGLASGFGRVGDSYFRTIAYIKKRNDDLFGPKGLTDAIELTHAMKSTIGMTTPDELKDLPLNGVPVNRIWIMPNRTHVEPRKCPGWRRCKGTSHFWI